MLALPRAKNGTPLSGESHLDVPSNSVAVPASLPKSGAEAVAGKDAAAAEAAVSKQMASLDATPSGLTSQAATKRLETYGPNALEEKKKSELEVLLGFF